MRARDANHGILNPLERPCIWRVIYDCILENISAYIHDGSDVFLKVRVTMTSISY